VYIPSDSFCTFFSESVCRTGGFLIIDRIAEKNIQFLKLVESLN